MKNLLITGGSRGIGKSIALLAAQNGYNIAINYASNPQAADQTLHELAQYTALYGIKAIAIQADVSSETEVETLFDTVEAGLGKITHLVNSAGITGRRSRLDQVSTADIRRTLEINALGTLLCARAAVQRMSTKHGGLGGVILNLSSAAATLGSPNDYIWYAASKAAIDATTLGLAREVALEGIRVNAIAPGFIATDMAPPERLEQVVPLVPMQRAGTTEEIAAAALFLLSEQSAYTTGAILRIAGGR
jgi:NAD(P)-dependent dehydrogenase (short-subunit alcohol dehydrogenase family)